MAILILGHAQEYILDMPLDAKINYGHAFLRMVGSANWQCP
jgi:hypothetical protein